jgi:predicted nucleic acid-binding protein
MKRRILLDSNVVVDFILKRTGFVENAEKIFKQIEEGTLIGCISSSAVTDVYYIVERKTNFDHAWKMMWYIYRTLLILPVIRKTIGGALDSGMKDFEDAVQAAATKDFGIDTIVTRDKPGFLNSGMRVYSPEEFLEALKTSP